MWLHETTCCPPKCCLVCIEKITVKILNCIVAGIAGLLFTTGWWCAIDAMCVFGEEFSSHAEFITLGVGSTVAFFTANVLAKRQSGHMNPLYITRSAVWCVRVLLFFAFFISFSMVFIAIVVTTLAWLSSDNRSKHKWPIFYCIPQTSLICTATILYYFGVRMVEV